jgi:predicted transcriptional regulator
LSILYSCFSLTSTALETKNDIDAKKTELKNLQTDKSDLEATQKKLKEMKNDQIDLIKRNLDLFTKAWDSVNTACVQIRTYIETGKLMVVRTVLCALHFGGLILVPHSGNCGGAVHQASS